MKVLVIGDAILDHYIYGTVCRSSPEDKTISILDVEREEYRLGGCMNVAANIKSLSYPRYFEVSLCSVFSEFTGELIQRKGIQADSSCIMGCGEGMEYPSKNELVKTRFIQLPNHKHLLRVDNRLQYREEDIEFYKEHFPKVQFNNYDAVVVSDYNKGLVNGFTLELLEEYEKPIFVDTKKEDLSKWANIKNCIVKINLKEFQESTNYNNLEKLIVTNGCNGCDLYRTPKPTRGKLFSHFPTDPIIDAEVTGAGDVFLAGLVVRYMQTEGNLEASINFANKMATKSVKFKGTTQVHPDEIRE